MTTGLESNKARYDDDQHRSRPYSDDINATLENDHMVTMFNDNQLFNSDIDTGRSKDVNFLEEMATEIEV
jgi:hypothetical protein